MEHKLPPILPGNFYHLHNKSSGHQKLFVTDENYHFFLEKYKHFMGSIADTYAYVLMPEHFHFLVRIKPEGELVKYFSKNRQRLDEYDTMINEQLSELFNTYSKSFNKKQNHKGELFLPQVKRKRIIDPAYLKNLVRYMHYEPVEAGVTKHIYKYDHSSYNALLNGDSSIISTGAIYELFNDPDSFVSFHKENSKDFHYNFMNE